MRQRRAFEHDGVNPVFVESIENVTKNLRIDRIGPAMPDRQGDQLSPDVGRKTNLGTSQVHMNERRKSVSFSLVGYIAPVVDVARECSEPSGIFVVTDDPRAEGQK